MELKFKPGDTVYFIHPHNTSIHKVELKAIVFNKEGVHYEVSNGNIVGQTEQIYTTLDEAVTAFKNDFNNIGN